MRKAAKRVLVGSVAFLSSGMATAAIAQDICASVLVPTRISQQLDHTEQLAYYHTIRTEQDFQRSRNANADGSYGLISGSASYGEFEQKRDALFKQTNFNMSVEHAQRFATSFLPPDTVDGWLRCMLATRGGIMLIAKDVTDDAVTLRAAWVAQKDTPEVTLHSVEATGVPANAGDLSGKFPKVWRGSYDSTVIVPRIKGKEFRAVINIGGHSDSVFIPVVSPPPPPPVRRPISVAARDFVRGQDVALQGPPAANYGADVLLNAPNGNYPERPNAAEWDFRAEAGGAYRMKAEYAAAAPRSVRIYLNGAKVTDNGLSSATGCWESTCQQSLAQGIVTLKQGWNTLRVERGGVFPHIRGFLFEPVD